MTLFRLLLRSPYEEMDKIQYPIRHWTIHIPIGRKENANNNCGK